MPTGDTDTIQRGLDHTIQELWTLAQAIRSEAAERSLADAADRLRSSSFTVAVLGAFNRGKSMLVNALLCANLLPTGVVPLTSVLTVVRGGSATRARVFATDGAVTDILPQGLHEYVTESGNPGNLKRVAGVEVEVPASFLNDGVVLVDTPGIGSTYSAGTRVTMELLPNVDAAILVLSVDPPISREEVEFVRSIRRYAGKVFYVLNKIDRVSHDELAEAVAFTKTSLQEALGSAAVELFPLSAKVGLGEGLTAGSVRLPTSQVGMFSTRLQAFLRSGKQQALFASTLNRVRSAASDLRLQLEIEQKLAKSTFEAREELRRRMRDLLQIVNEHEESVSHILHGRTSRVIEVVGEDVERYREDRLEFLRKSTRQFALRAKGSPKERAVAVDAFIHENVEKMCLEFLRPEEQKVGSELQRTAEMASSELNRVVDDLRRRAGEILGVDLPMLPGEVTLPPADTLSFKFEDRLYRRDSMVDTLISLAGSVTKERLAKRAEEAVWLELDRNLGRIRSDLQQRTEKTLRSFEGQVGQGIDRTNEAISRGIETGKSENPRERLEQIESMKRRLADLEEQLQRLQAELAGGLVLRAEVE